MKKVIILIIIGLSIISCNGYIGGFDDYNRTFTQFVFINRSSHSIDILLKDFAWNEGDTIHVEAHGGLWKHTIDGEFYGHSFDWAKIIFDGKESFIYDSFSNLPHNPCINHNNSLSDSKGIYIFNEYSDDTYKEISESYEKLKEFNMFSIRPSVINEDSLITSCSSEALFQAIYPVPEVWNELKLGTSVSKEAENLENIGFLKDRTIAIDSIHIIDHSQYEQQRYNEAAAGYYSLYDLGKMGLAHFGCDFAALTGRNTGEMGKFSGVMFTHAHSDWTETFFDDDIQQEEKDKILNDSGNIAIVNNVAHGRLMILLAEADHSHNRILKYLERLMYNYGDQEEYYIEDMDFYLITRKENGEFQCRKGGKELLDEYRSYENNEPVLPLYFTVTDFSGTQAYIHINDIALE